MYRIEQHIANQIARTQMMATDQMRDWFGASENKIQELKMQMQQTIQQENGNKKVARAFISLLPLVVEYYAINNFFTQFKESDHFCAGLSTIEEALKMAKNDFHLTLKE